MLIRLDMFDRAFTNDCAFRQDSDNARNLANEAAPDSGKVALFDEGR